MPPSPPARRKKLEASSFVDEADYQDIALKVGVAAIKFGDLINQRAKDYVFDLSKSLFLEGKTYSHLLYTITRINSILKKAGVPADQPLLLTGVYTDSERELLLKILMGGDVFQRTLAEKAPNYLCGRRLSAGQFLLKFYHDNRIIDEPDEAKKQSWLALISLVRQVLCNHLDLLGIETVEHM